MMRPNMIPIHPDKVQVEGRKTKADVVQQLATNRFKRCDEIIVSM